MTVTATYDDATGKVSLAVASAPSNAATVLFERSPDAVTWSTVRGGQAVPVSGGIASLNDYEYAAGVTNHYRVSYLSTGTPTMNPAHSVKGTTATNVPATTTPAIVTSLSAVTGDLVFVMVNLSAAPTSGTITCTTAGWSVTRIGTLGAVLMARYSASLTNPVIAATVGTTTRLSWYAFSYTNAILSASTSQANTTATSVAYPASPAQPSGSVVSVLLEGRAAAYTDPANPVGTEHDVTAGWVAYQNASGWTSGSTTFATGTVTATSWAFGAWLAQAPYILRETGTVTPLQTGCWLKNPLRPYLNRKVTVVDFADLTRASRSGVFDIIGRTDPVGVTDLMSGRSTSVVLRTSTAAEADDLDLVLAVGEVLYLQPAYQAAPPTLYAVPTGLNRARPAQTSAARRFTVPLTEVAAPDPGLAAVQSTWQTVISTYATWADVVAAKATWNAVLQLVGSAGDVITS